MDAQHSNTSGDDDDPIPDIDLSTPGSDRSGNGGPVLSHHAYSTHYGVLMDFVQSHRDELTRTLKGGLKQGLWAGGGAVTGGILAGPLGGLIGGIVGSIAGFTQSADYDGFVQLMLNLRDGQQRTLIQSVSTILLHHGARTTALATATTFGTALREFAENNAAVRDEIWKACLDITRE